MRIVPLLVASALASTPAVAFAQDCASMSLFKQGSHQARTSYNAKGKEQGVTTIDVTGVSTSGAAITATARSVSSAKGKETGAVDFTMTCEAGAYKVDMKSMVSPTATEAYKDWTLTMEGGDMGFPATLSAGQTLDDASLKMTFSMATEPGSPVVMPSTVMTYTAAHRVVVGPESITTAAGTFETWKVTYDITVATKGIVSSTQVMQGTDWYVHGLGPVKSEMWAKGKLQATTVLTENR